MPVLRIILGDTETDVPFEGTPTVREALLSAGIRHDHPCGGRGVCGKCAVRISGVLSAPTERERIPGYRLSCVTRLLGDAEIRLSGPDRIAVEGAEENGEDRPATPGTGKQSLTGVFDIGTTTVAFRLLDADGTVIAENGTLNPQRDIAADVIGRIAAAKENGTRQTEMIRRCMTDLLRRTGVPESSGIRYIVTGNTVMLYLLTGTDPEELGRAPFSVSRRFDETAALPFGDAYLPPCTGAFTGADLSCAVLASRMTESNVPALLCDAGTNGELALWDGKVLRVTSVAAGPAFEGVGIRNGCMNIPGAVNRVRLVNGGLFAETVGGQRARGICGSGVLDAVACGLLRGDIDETGFLAEPLALGNGIALYPEDVRAVQQAKAAVAAGIGRLTEEAGIAAGDIRVWYLCGGFGSRLDPVSAVTVGMLPPEAAGRTAALGNAALNGACALRYDAEKEKLRRIADRAETVTLGGDPAFGKAYIAQMMFPVPAC